MVDIEYGLAVSPQAHPVIEGLRGVRKARIRLAGRGKGGGGRVVSYVSMTPSVLFMLTAYPKNEQDDLSNEQRTAILAALEGIKGDAG